MEFKKLEFNPFGEKGALYAETGFGISYFLLKDFDKGNIKVKTLSHNYELFPGFDQAKEWCQKDFENRVMGCIVQQKQS